MSSDLILIMRTFFSNIWNIFTSIRIPGVNFSPAVMMFGIMSFGLAMKLLKGVLQISSDGISKSVNNKAAVKRSKDE